MEDLQDVFGKRLKRFMQEKNMTQRKLAKATGLTDVTISRYTNGTRLPGADELLKLSNALSVSADDLIGNGKVGETRGIHPGDIVQHFKRQRLINPGQMYLYRIIAFGEHTETKEKEVIYQALYEDADLGVHFGIYVRPFDMFFSEVDRVKYPENEYPEITRSTGLRNTTGKEFVDFSFVRETQLIHPVMDVWVEIWQDETSI